MSETGKQLLDDDLLDDDRVSVPRAAKLLGVSVTLMHELLDKGRIPYEVPNKQRRVSLADVERYRKSRRHAGRKARQTYEDLLAD